MPTIKVVVSIPGAPAYDVRIGSGVLDGIGTALRELPATARAPRVLIVSDATVAPLYLKGVRDAVSAAGFRVSDITIPAGEEAKSLDVVAEVWEAMASLSLGRDCAVLALGGGVVGDLAGFVGATYMRGVTVVQAPTTLLSMVDSSVGGKTGVNLRAGKNLVGAFKQPAYVCADIATLATLDEREWACGLAEIAKSSVIDSDDFFFWMMESAAALARRDEAAVVEAIARSVAFKANVVAQDETESRGVRECLNYGHTFGHAIETLAGYGTYSHGAAVAEGMRFAAQLGAHLLGTSEELVAAQDDLLDALGIAPLGWTADPRAVLDAMKRDKKVRGGAVRFVLPIDVGRWEIATVDDEVVLEAVAAWFA